MEIRSKNKSEVIAMVQEFFFTFIITLLIVLIFNYIGQRLIVKKNKFDNKTILVVIVQSLVIALLLAFVF